MCYSRKEQIISIFQKYYADILQLLKTCSENVPAQLYSRKQINFELMRKSKSKILEALMTSVQVEPEMLFDIIKCLEVELDSSSILKNMKGKHYFTMKSVCVVMMVVKWVIEN